MKQKLREYKEVLDDKLKPFLSKEELKDFRRHIDVFFQYGHPQSAWLFHADEERVEDFVKYWKPRVQETKEQDAEMREAFKRIKEEVER